MAGKKEEVKEDETIQEVEKHLLETLGKAIEDTERDDNRTLSCVVNLNSKFKELKKKLEDQSMEKSERRRILYHLSNLLGEWQNITKKHGIHAPEALFASYKLSKSLKKIKIGSKTEGSVHQSQNQILEDNAGSSEVPSNFEPYRWSSRFRSTPVYGLEDKIRFMERSLVEEDKKNMFKGMAIVGVTGVGKTGLCQVMFNNEKVKAHYLLRLWVCLSKQPEDDEDYKKEVVKRILLCLGIEQEVLDLTGKDSDGNQGLHKLISALRLQLKDKKYLIVLDDVNASSEDKFFENLSSEGKEDELAYGLPNGEGNMVIVTTRSEELAGKMVGEENVHELPKLKDHSLCWKIFEDTVKKGGGSAKDYEGLKELVVKKCNGLPLAATMLGEIVLEQQRLDKSKIKFQFQQAGRVATI